MTQLEDVQFFYNPFAYKIPKTFDDCQSTQCRACKYSIDIPMERTRQPDYFDYCLHRKALQDSNDKMPEDASKKEIKQLAGTPDKSHSPPNATITKVAEVK